MPKRQPRDWFAFRAAAAGANPELYIYDYIGKSWWNEKAMSASKLIEVLKEYAGQHIDVHINSLGGDAFEGQAIHNALKRHDGGTTCYIDGVCYSAATFAALGCDTVHMAANAVFGIHKAWTWAVGNTDEMDRTAKALKKVDHTQVVVYEAKTGLSRADILATMAEDVPLTAEEALESGYVDVIGDEVDPAAMARSEAAILAHHVPEHFAQRIAAFGVVQSAADEEELSDKLELVREYATSIVETVDELLEEDTTDTTAEATLTVEASVPACPADTHRKVGSDVAALLTSSEKGRVVLS